MAWSEQEFKKKMSSWWWRMNNLYAYHDEDNGQILGFRPNWAQRKFWSERSQFTIVPKSRRQGISTGCVIEMTDHCIFNSGQIAALIDYKENDAKKKLFWVSIAWKNMGRFCTDGLDSDDERKDFNQWLMKELPLLGGNTKDPGTEEVKWANGSRFYCDTSVRGGMVSIGHISEFGKIAFKYPAKAKEIMAGMTPAVAVGNRLTIESTFEGGEFGQWYELITEAMKNLRGPWGPRDFKMLFFSFLDDVKRRLPADSVKLRAAERAIFDEYEKQGVKVPAEQKAFWIMEYRTHKEQTFKEWPITISDMWRSPAEGAIYAPTLLKRQLDGACLRFAIEKKYPCFVGFDLGQADAMAIWLVQKTPMEWRWLDFNQAHYENPEYAVSIINDWKRYCYIQTVFLPHDGKKTENSGKTYVEYLNDLGIGNVMVVPRTTSEWIGIWELKSIFETSVFHQRVLDGYKNGVGQEVNGWKLLNAFRSEKRPDGVAVRDVPVHDHTSHCAAAARCIAEANLAGWISPHIEIRGFEKRLHVMR